MSALPAFCDTTPVPAGGARATICSFCHRGSILPDSTLNDSANVYVYHDRMTRASGAMVPVTSALHANGSVDVRYVQCIKCHDNPPDFNVHYLHVWQYLLQCCECHLYSVRCGTVRGPDPSNPGDTIVRFVQLADTGLEGRMIPIADGRAHLNNKVDIVMKRRVEDSLNLKGRFDPARFVWDNFTKDCYNLPGCHKSGNAGVNRR
jgi:hypothetical protein